MKNLAVANALALNDYALRPVVNGQNSLKRIRHYASQLPGVRRCLLLLPEGVDVEVADLGFDIRRLKTEGVADLLRTLQSALSEEEYDNLFYFFADCPLLDSALSTRMLDNHGKYYADYTFADGYPYGLSPEILKPAVLSPLLELAEKSQPVAGEELIRARDRGVLFELIKKDINAFDVETELSPVDLRMIRAELCADCKRNLALVQRVVQAGAQDAEAVCRILEKQPEILRTLPSFFSIQIVEGCPQLCSYCPYPRIGIKKTGKQGQMELEDFNRILEQIQLFCAEATLSVSLWGEPAYHAAFADLALAVLERGFHLVVDTSGIGWPEGVFARIAEKKHSGLDWVVSLDSRDPKEYTALRGQGFEEAHKTVEALQSLFPGHVYPQAVRMNENEEGLEDFYRYWKNTTGRESRSPARAL